MVSIVDLEQPRRWYAALRNAPLTHQALSQDPGVTATLTPLDNNRVSVTLSPVQYYASVMIAASNP